MSAIGRWLARWRASVHAERLARKQAACPHWEARFSGPVLDIAAMRRMAWQVSCGIISMATLARLHPSLLAVCETCGKRL